MIRLALIAVLLAFPLRSGAEEEWTPPPPRRVIDPSDGTQPARPPLPPPPTTGTAPMPAAAWLMIGLAIGAVGVGIYKFILEPRRKQRPLIEALEIIATRDATRYKEADQKLAEALTRGLGRRDLATARFQLAYLRAQRKLFSEALAVLSDVPPAERDKEVLYLQLWLLHHTKAADRVETHYRDHVQTLGDFLDTRTIVGITYLEKARKFWAAKQITAAVEYFNKVRSLGVLLEEIPEHIDDHQIVLGVAAIHMEDYDEAARHFRGAASAASSANKSTVPGRLGELICVWRREEEPEIDSALGEVAAELAAATTLDDKLGRVNCAHANCGHEYLAGVRSAGKRVTCIECRRSFKLQATIEVDEDAAKLDPDTQPDRLLVDDELMLRNVRLWHVVTCLFGWKKHPARERPSDAMRRDLRDRIKAVRAVDPNMCDVDLIHGLISYYFAPQQEGRNAAVKVLEKAVDRGINLPAVIDLINREKKLEAYLADGLTRFFEHVEDYVGDSNVLAEYRNDLYERLNRYERYQHVKKPHGVEADAAPSLEDLQNRSRILRDRVKHVQQKLLDADPEGAEAQSINDMVGDLETESRSLADTAQKVQQVEHDLMASTSEFLLREDET